jgi:hypothetical protein
VTDEKEASGASVGGRWWGSFSEARQQGLAYRGDIHIEPHHGTNISYPTQKKLAELIGQAKDFTELGNKYLPQVAIE